MNKSWKVTIGILFALAILLGLVQRKNLADFSLGKNHSIAKVDNGADGSLLDFYQEAQSLAASKNDTSTTTVTFLAAGDINLSRDVAAEIAKQKNPDYPFLGMANVLKSTDFNFANLESPFAPSAADNVIGGNSMTFGAPLDYSQGLKDYNFYILNSANNHAFDQGVTGMGATRSELDKLGIAHEGTGDNLGQAWTPAVVNIKNIKICFIGASYGTNSGGAEAAKYIALITDIEHLKSAVEKARSQCDFIVVTMHAGTEYTRQPTQSQIDFAHIAIDDGADMVIGAHPHWVQPVEKYCPLIGSSSSAPNLTYDPSRCKYIFYSLGNFIFDQSWSQDTQEGLALKITLSKTSAATNPMTTNAANSQDLQGQRNPAKLESIELLPITIINTQPSPANDEETKKILQNIGETKNILN